MQCSAVGVRTRRAIAASLGQGRRRCSARVRHALMRAAGRREAGRRGGQSAGAEKGGKERREMNKKHEWGWGCEERKSGEVRLDRERKKKKERKRMCARCRVERSGLESAARHDTTRQLS